MNACSTNKDEHVEILPPLPPLPPPPPPPPTTITLHNHKLSENSKLGKDKQNNC